jgi:beta-glucosidase
VELQPGEAKTVTVSLEPLALSIYDTRDKRWRQPKGRYGIFVGGSSRETPLEGSFTLR